MIGIIDVGVIFRKEAFAAPSVFCYHIGIAIVSALFGNSNCQKGKHGSIGFVVTSRYGTGWRVLPNPTSPILFGFCIATTLHNPGNFFIDHDII